MNAAARELLARLGFPIPPERPMMEPAVAQLQLVEIGKALSHGACVIIMAEPTSALGEAEADQLFRTVARLEAQRTEILECLIGLGADRTAGTVAIEGRPVRIRTPREAIGHGLALVTEDRKGAGLVLSQSARAKIAMAGLEGLSNGPAMSVRRERTAAKRMIGMFGIRAASDRLEVSGLSGGNQQEVVLGKWILTAPRILLLDEPTGGVDGGAKGEIYRIMSDFAEGGDTVVMVSSESDEVMGTADRVVVIRDGRVAGELDRAGATPKALVNLAA